MFLKKNSILALWVSVLGTASMVFATIDGENHNATTANSNLRSSRSFSPSLDSNEDTPEDLRDIISKLVDRVDALEAASKEDRQTILDTEERILCLETQLEEMEDAATKYHRKIASLEGSFRAVGKFRRYLQERPAVTVGGNEESGDGGNEDDADTDADADSIDPAVCLPQLVGGRCVFGHEDIVAFRFENEIFFNDDVEFNENVGFDEDADCMPTYNSTSRTCRLYNNFTYMEGMHKFEPETEVVVRSNEVWMRAKKTFFRNTETFFQGGALNILGNVDYTKKEAKKPTVN